MSGRRGRAPDSGLWGSAGAGWSDQLQLWGPGGLRPAGEHQSSKLFILTQKVNKLATRTCGKIQSDFEDQINWQFCSLCRPDQWGSSPVFPFIASGLRIRWQRLGFAPAALMLTWSPKRGEEKIRGKGRRKTIEGSIIWRRRTLFKMQFKICQSRAFKHQNCWDVISLTWLSMVNELKLKL